jgi:hypothetical protein
MFPKCVAAHAFPPMSARSQPQEWIGQIGRALAHLGALVYAGLYAVLPEAIAWRALFAAPTSLSPRPAANDAPSHDLGSP